VTHRREMNEHDATNEDMGGATVFKVEKIFDPPLFGQWRD